MLFIKLPVVLAGSLALAMLWFGPVRATETLVALDDIRSDEILMVGFELPQDAEVTVEALGLRMGSGNKLAAYGWILDHETREPVWVMERRHRDRDRSRGERVVVEEPLNLKAGKYELYMAAVSSWYSGDWDGDYNSMGEIFDDLGKVFGKKSSRHLDRELRNCYINVLSDELTRHQVKTFEVTGKMDDALLQFNAMGDDEYIKQGFKLSRDGTIRVYALVEIPSKTSVDRAWIVRAENLERVWETTYRNTDVAGGGKKNRVANDELELEAGEYILFFATDDSHSWEYYNTQPPFDPVNWGVALLPGPGMDKRTFSTFDAPERGDALVELTRARDDDYLEQAFKLSRESELYVRCFGEYSDWSDEFVDYGVIQNIATGELVFEMTGRNTAHAGGAEKNRGFEGSVTLPAGRYLAYYVTDGSHSYRDWNASAPYEPESWGLTIYPGQNYRKGALEKLSERALTDDGKLLARLVRLRDDERRQARFTIENPTRVHIFALGEGSDGDMYDYGWIEDRKTGLPVWEMTWRKTRHAGGAEKNRVFTGEITLDPGEYEVYFITDGSHSFNDWNSSKPRNPSQWGITVSVAGSS
jgi:hypothetical protein